MRIRVRSGFTGPWDPDREGRRKAKKREKIKNGYFLRAGVFSLC
jgi:hypothetical protein